MAVRTVAAVFPAAMETIHPGYRKMSPRAAMHGGALSQISSRNARLSVPEPISGHGVDDVSLVSPDSSTLDAWPAWFSARFAERRLGLRRLETRAAAVCTYAVETPSPI